VSRSASVNAVPLLRRGLMSRLYPARCVRITGWPNAVESDASESGAVDPSVADPGSINFGSFNLGSVDAGSADPSEADPDSVDSMLKGEFSRDAELLAKRINASK
jgi:hypothetical protein